MLHWLRYPFLRLTPAFAAGILLFEVSDRPDIKWYYSLILLFSFSLLIFLSRKRFFSINPVIGLSSLIMIGCLGFLLTGLQLQFKNRNHFSNGTIKAYTGKIVSWPEKRGDYKRFIFKVNGVKDSCGWQKSNGDIQIYIHDDGSPFVSFGTLMVVSGAPSEIDPPRNPMEFDYKHYLLRRNITHQHFLEKEDFIIAGQDKRGLFGLFETYPGRLREKSDRILQSHIKEDRQKSIARAMLLGIRSGMDKEMKDAYSHAGAMHILAISGLHIGIFYGFLALLLAPLRQTRNGRFVFTIVIVTVLWFYALMVGASPSVMRAVVMFSLIAVGYAFYRAANIFNTIAFSAFVLLLVNPNQLFDVGFQMSYLAVTGIVLLFRPINSWISSKYWIINKLWSITSVAIAAQLVTFPLGLYYFHNFPSLFFLSNVLVIPSALVILISGMALLIFSIMSFNFLTGLLSDVLTFMLDFMNKGVMMIENIPYSSISKVYLSGSLTLLLYLLLIGLIASSLTKKIQWFYFLGFFWVLFFISITLVQIKNQKMQILAIYDIPHTTVLDVFYKGSFKTFSPPGSQPDIGYQVDNYRIAMAGNKKPGQIQLFQDSKLGIRYFQIAGSGFIWIKEEIRESFSTDKKIPVDYLLVSNNSIRDLNIVTDLFDPGMIVLDSSNDYYYSRRAESYYLNKGLKVYNTRNSGGLIIDLKSKTVKNWHEL